MEFAPFGQSILTPAANESTSRCKRPNDFPKDTVSVFHFSFLIFNFDFLRLFKRLWGGTPGLLWPFGPSCVSLNCSPQAFKHVRRTPSPKIFLLFSH